MALRPLVRVLLRSKLLLKDISHNHNVCASKYNKVKPSRNVSFSRTFYTTTSVNQIKIESVKEIDNGVSLTFNTTQEHKL